MSNQKKIIIIGAGGHSKSLIDILRLQKREILGYIDNNSEKHNKDFYALRVLGGDESINDFSSQEVSLVNGIGSTKNTSLRKKVFESFKEKGFEFETVIHPQAIVSPSAILEEGVQVLAGSIIQADSKIEKNSIINTRVSIDHDCHIEEHVHIAPGSTLSGTVNVGKESHIGTGAIISNNISIGQSCLIAAGAVVVGNVEDGKTVRGVPAK